jgi:hypothetical protein
LTVSDPQLTLDQVDQQLTHWEAQVARVKANLDLLNQTPSYAFIVGGLKLTGRTEREIVEPILAARELTDQYEMLAGQVARARLLRDSLRGFFPSNRFLPPNQDTLREIDRLLNQPCVPLPAAQITLAQRTLLDDPAAASQLSLRQLVEVMAPAFTAARDAVTRYDQVMGTLTPVLKAADKQLAILAASAAALGQLASTAVANVRSTFAQIRRRALDDPLEVQLDLEQALQQHLRTLTDKLAALKREQADIREMLVRAQARQARASHSHALDPAQVADLGTWLASIAHTLQSGEYAAARIGLQRWASAADPIYATEEQRQEQLGLLKALRVMAERRREKGAPVDPDLDGIALEAESVLRRRPADLARAKQLVERYQRGVSTSL